MGGETKSRGRWREGGGIKSKKGKRVWSKEAECEGELWGEEQKGKRQERRKIDKREGE